MRVSVLARFLSVCLVPAALVALAPRSATALDRTDVPAKYKWNLTDVFASRADWEKARAEVESRIPEVAGFQGHLGDSAAGFYRAVSTIESVRREMEKVYTYASMLHDQDLRVSENLQMDQSAQNLAVKLGTAASYLRPEILAMGKEKVESFLAAEPKLAPYKPYLEDLLRWAPHTLNPPEEKIVAQAGNLTGAGSSVYSVFTNADMPFPTVVMAGGDSVRMDPPNYGLYRGSDNRADRMTAFHAFFSTYQDFRRTLAATLYAQTKAHIFDRDVHHFDSCVQEALFGDNIPVSVYDQLTADTHASLPVLFRYLNLRKRMMNLDTLRYEDLYASIVKDVDLKYTPEEAMDMTLASFAPLGAKYVDTLRKGYRSGWVDFMPNRGKRQGAYSTDVYGVHPYELLNFTGTFEEVSTLAHESGHSMHTYLADQAQPYVTHDYATFVAEVASTLNENLLFHYALDHAKSDDERLFLLGNYLDNVRTTIFRQVMFGEFERKFHEMAEKGTSLTGDNLNDLYLGIVRTYYGADKGVCAVDSLYAAEWAFVPHFYYDFYVYQYATSMVAAISIANGIRSEASATPPSTAERDAYLAMLAKGSSEYPVDLLKGAGVDMTTSAPFQAAMAEMNHIMDKIEAILDRQEGKR